MSEGMLIRCKKAATTDSKSAIASPTHLTSPRIRDSQPATAPHLATTGTSIIIQNKEAENEQHETPDLSTQLERAKRFGHNLSQVKVGNRSAHQPTPAYPIAPKMIQCRLTIGRSGDKDAQEADKVAQQVMAMPVSTIQPKIQRIRDERRNVQLHEDSGGHTEERHIGKSENSLKKRLREEPETESASSFYNKNSANRTQGEFVQQFHEKIEAWLKTGEARFVREISMKQPIGIVVKRSKKGDALPAVQTHKARMVLLRDNSSQGWHFLTSFPIP